MKAVIATAKESTTTGSIEIHDELTLETQTEGQAKTDKIFISKSLLKKTSSFAPHSGIAKRQNQGTRRLSFADENGLTLEKVKEFSTPITSKIELPSNRSKMCVMM